MEQRSLPFSRIRFPRAAADSMTITAQAHQDAHLIAYATPAYPEEAKAKGIEGKVVLDTLIGKDGIIQRLSVREGDPLLAESALQTVRHWQYRPTTVNGVPVEVETLIEVNFSATSESPSRP
jgi:TonB family protein